MSNNETSVNKFKKIINLDYPDFKIESIKPLKSGWCNFAFEINKDYIFRFPKTDDVNLELEDKILKILNNKTTLEIPVYRFFGKNQPYVGYKKIVGKPLTEDNLKLFTSVEKKTLANDLANFLYEFHSFLPVSKAKILKLKSDNHKWRPEVIQKYVIGKLSDNGISNFIEEHLNKYLEFIKDNSELVIAYNDLHQNNVAFDEKNRKLKGIFDFGDVAVEHISMEFYRLFSFDQKLTIDVIKYYEKISGRKIDIHRVFTSAVVSVAAMLGVYGGKKNSKKYKDTLKDLLRLKVFVTKLKE